MAKVAIICHLERLWPEYEAGQAYFGLNLSASFDGESGSKEEALSLLMPWLWGNVEKIHVKRKSAPMAEEVDDIEYVIGAEDLFDPEPIKNAILDEASDMLANLTEGIESFVWRPNIGTEEEEETRRYFRNLLGYVSTLPAPTPQNLNLSLCFKLPVSSLTIDDLIYAVPEFKGGTLGNLKPLSAGPGSAISRPGVQVSPWSYSSGAHTVTAYTVPWTVVASETSDKSFIDFSSYWIKREFEANQPTWYGTDWTVRMEGKIAAAFDLTQRLIDAFRANLEVFKQPAKFNDQDYVEKVLKFFRQSVVTTTRDLAGTGVQPGADGADVAGYLLSRCRDTALENSGLMESLRLSMRGALEFYNRSQTYQEWVELLKSFPEIKATAALRNPSEFRRRDKLDEELGELETIQSALADENNLRDLLLAQWRQAVDKPGAVANTTATTPPAVYFQSVRPEKGEIGLLGLNDGRAWVLTLANLNLQQLPANGFLQFNISDPKAASQIQISIEARRTASGNLRVRLLDAGGVEKAQAEFSDLNYHLRLQIMHKAETEWLVTAQVGKGVNIWQPVGGGGISLTTTSKLNAAAVSITLGGGATSATFTPPSALVVTPDKLADAIKSWDQAQFNKAGAFLMRFNSQLKNTVLPAIQLRQRLASGNIGRIWGEIIALKHSFGNEFGQLIDHLKEKLEAYYDGRIDSVTPIYSDYLKLPGVATTGEVTSHIKTTLAGYIESFKQVLLPNAAESVDEGDSSPTEISQGVTIQVDRLAKFVEGDSSDAQDFLRRIAGVGVLMRQAPSGSLPSAWRCLNLAELRAEKPSADNDQTLKLVFSKSLAPYRLTYQNDLRQALVTYNDNPLIAKSPAAKLSGGVNLEDEFDDGSVVRIEYTPAHKNSDWAKLPPLKFGQTYDLAAFVIGNSGALPKELTDGHPAKLRASTEGFQPDLSPYLRRVKYLRRVRVGKPRFASQQIGKVGRPEIQLPRIPKQVLPLAGELKLKPESVSGIPLPDPSEDMTFQDNNLSAPVVNAGAQNLPLLLLPYRNGKDLQSTFVFGLRKPATDLTTWNRWMAKDQDAETGTEKPTAKKREQVWADYHRKAPKDASQAEQDNREDITLDDPAAADFFVAELVPMRAKGMTTSKVVTVLTSPSQANAGVKLAQAPPVRVTCKLGELSSIKSEIGQLTVEVGFGEVVELRIYVPVDSKWFDDESQRRFHKLPTPPAGAWKKFEDRFYLFSPLRLILEGVSNELPPAQELWRAIRPVATGSRLAVHFDRGVSTPTNKFDYVAKVDLRRQLWRWQGRPLAEFPALSTAKQLEINKLPDDDTSGSTATHAFLWDAEGFGDRGDDDYMLTSTAIGLTDSSPVLFEDDRSQDRRALYYRFAVRAHSRYQGLLTNNFPEFVDSSRHALPSVPESSTSPVDRWKRHLLDCRWQDEVPKPQVKFVVPLTESASAGSATNARMPGLLVVLNETWYEVGGLAEKLVAELQQVSNPFENKEIPQFGPDPILTGDSWSGDPVKLDVSQPIGHTFDTDTEAPLFVASSCVLSLPDLPKSVEDKWCFAKIAFKRSLIINGAETAVESKPTDPYWVQLLPDFSQFNDNFDYDKLKLRRESSGSNAIVILSGETPMALPADPPLTGFNQFTRWLLLTQVIRDMRGRRDQERYVGLYRLGTNGVCSPLDPQTKLASDWKLRGRIVEVQYRVEKLSNMRSHAVYYDGASLAGGNQWVVTLSGIKGSFAAQQGINFSINRPSSVGSAEFLGIAVTYGVDGSARLQLNKGGAPVGASKALSSSQASSPYGLRLVLTKTGNSLDVSAQYQVGTTWEEFRTTTHDALLDISVQVQLNPAGGSMPQLGYIAPALAAEPWDHLFPLEMPGATPEDAKARIVRVSRPIEM
ncbi:MAG: hypothetical protein JNK38_16460 [Acidobacteria bacterium]|nr:hypothetical protein [Acidobacteriota bacterium]